MQAPAQRLVNGNQYDDGQRHRPYPVVIPGEGGDQAGTDTGERKRGRVITVLHRGTQRQAGQNKDHDHGGEPYPAAVDAPCADHNGADGLRTWVSVLADAGGFKDGIGPEFGGIRDGYKANGNGYRERQDGDNRLPPALLEEQNQPHISGGKFHTRSQTDADARQGPLAREEVQGNQQHQKDVDLAKE